MRYKYNFVHIVGTKTIYNIFWTTLHFWCVITGKHNPSSPNWVLIFQVVLGGIPLTPLTRSHSRKNHHLFISTSFHFETPDKQSINLNSHFLVPKFSESQPLYPKLCQQVSDQQAEKSRLKELHSSANINNIWNFNDYHWASLNVCLPIYTLY